MSSNKVDLQDILKAVFSILKLIFP